MKAYFLTAVFFLFTGLFSQTYQWGQRSGGVDDDEVFDLCHDPAGNVYIIGIFEGTADLDAGPGTANFTALGAGDAFFAKYDAAGNFQWAKTIGSPGDEEGLGIKLDAAGNIYITGLFSGTADFDPGPNAANLTSLGGFDVFIARYDNSGNYVWAKNFGSNGNVDDYPSHMVLDAGGTMYVIGQFGGTCDFDPGPGTASLSSSGGMDVFFAKYDALGNYIWARSIDNTTNADDFGYGIAIDGFANVLITGQYDGTCDFDPGSGAFNLTSAGGWDIFFAKYDGTGNFLWAGSLGGPSDDYGMHITVDNSNNVYITGSFMGSADFDPGNGTANLTSGGLSDIYIGKYTSGGAYTWAENISGTGDDLGNCIIVDGMGGIYITGQFASTADFDPGPGTASLTSAGSWDVFFAKYRSDGSYYWSAKIGGAGVDQSHIIDYDASGYFLIGGEHPNTLDFDPGPGTASSSSFGLDDFYFAKYLDASTGVSDNDHPAKDLFVYPNPASTQLQVLIPGIADGTIRLIDMRGEILAEFDAAPVTSIGCSSYADGVYLLSYCTDIMQAQKLIIIAR